MSEYREECIERKLVQRGIQDAKPVGGRKIRTGPKSYLLECFFFGRWGWAGRYHDLKTANQAFDQQSRKHPRRSWRLKHNEAVVRGYEA